MAIVKKKTSNFTIDIKLITNDTLEEDVLTVLNSSILYHLKVKNVKLSKESIESKTLITTNGHVVFTNTVLRELSKITHYLNKNNVFFLKLNVVLKNPNFETLTTALTSLKLDKTLVFKQNLYLNVDEKTKIDFYVEKPDSEDISNVVSTITTLKSTIKDIVSDRLDVLFSKEY